MHAITRMYSVSRNVIALMVVTALTVAATTPTRGQSIDKSLVRAQGGEGDFPLVHAGVAAGMFVDAGEYESVRLAAADLQADLGRVTGVKPALAIGRAPVGGAVVIAGTLGKSALIDGLVNAGKVNVDGIAGKWESFLITTVDNPVAGVEQGLIVVGSDRRGTAYGLYEISQQSGVSPWHWWADVPVQRHESLYVKAGKHVQGSPAVKYRGIFINDEDWGLHVWAARTLEPESRGIGPKTYEKVFGLMNRLRLNYLWPAMHEITREFHSIPENIELAHRYGIVAGASHCEPMLFNNAKWNQNALGRWDYTINRQRIHSTWEESARTRGDKEAVWTLGIRGIHDQGMQGPREIPTRIEIVSEVFKDQRALLEKHATSEWGPVAQCFVPYKEVLTLYDAGLKVPDDVTLVWVDDNFGYIRRLGAPGERQRAGGAGVYWHLSYYGGPHSYLWINTTAPALMWEELHKAWENDARRLWIINVGDIKPMEIGIDYFAKLAWNPEGMAADSQPRFLREFAATQFGVQHAEAIAELLGEFYRLGTVRKPELMTRAWAVGLPEDMATQLRLAYEELLRREEALSATIVPDAKDAFFQLIGFPARVLGASGIIFMADRAMQLGNTTGAHQEEISRQRAFLESQVDHFNNGIAGGKWKHMMPGMVTAANLTAWNSQVRWPWGERPVNRAWVPSAARVWRDAASANRQTTDGPARWTLIEGLGHTARALALKPTSLGTNWKEQDPSAPALEFDFDGAGAAGDLLIDFLPTFRIYPGIKMRVAVSIDDQPATLVEVPGSSGSEDEQGPIRNNSVQDNFTRARLPLPALPAGRHVLRIRAVDPGVVIDRISLPG